MFPGFVFRGLFYIFFSLLSPELMNWSVLREKKKKDSEPWSVKDTEWDGWGDVSPEVAWDECNPWAGENQWLSWNTECPGICLSVICEGQRTTQSYGFICSVTLRIFPPQPTLLLLLKCLEDLLIFHGFCACLASSWPISLLFSIFWPLKACGILVPDQVSNSCLLQWKHGVLTTGITRSPLLFVWYICFLH